MGGYRLLTGEIGEGGYGGGQVLVLAFGALMLFAGIRTLKTGGTPTVVKSPMHDFAREYTAAWCSQNPMRVARFFAERGALTINGGAPAAGRQAIAESARGFMEAFPDM